MNIKIQIKPSDFKDELDRILREYGDDCTDKMDEVLPEVAKEAASKLRSKSKALFKKGNSKKHYASGWRRKVTKNGNHIEVEVYNSSKPYLTHLLENGHNGLVPVRKKGGGYYYKSVGWVSGREHIAPVNEWAQKEVIERLEKEL